MLTGLDWLRELNMTSLLLRLLLAMLLGGIVGLERGRKRRAAGFRTYMLVCIGAGFYECVLLGIVLIFLCVRILPIWEAELRKRSRNLNLYIEFSTVQDVRQITACLKQMGVTVVDVEVEPGRQEDQRGPNAIFALRLKRRQPHAEVLSAVFRLEHIRKIDEL